MYRADEKGIIFQTSNVKDLCKQLQENPHVELCFFSNEKNIQIRISGKATFVNDLDLKGNCPKTSLSKSLGGKKGIDMIIVLRIVDCVAHQWTMETNFLPKEYINL